MIASKITSRYAKALIDLSKEQNNLDACLEDMKLLKIACEENHDLSLLLKSPIINADKKWGILEQIFSKKVSKVSLLFIQILTRKKREGLLPLIAENFIHLYKKSKNIAVAKVTTANPLDDQLRKQIVDFMKEGNKESIELNEEIDEAILGGAIIKMGDKQIDGSVRRNLKNLKNTYSQNLYIKDF